jgi:hypothetical protein
MPTIVIAAFVNEARGMNIANNKQGRVPSECH